MRLLRAAFQSTGGKRHSWPTRESTPHVRLSWPRSPRRPLCYFVRSLPQVFIPCARSTSAMRPTRKAVRFFARALGALADVLWLERYYHSDIRRTAVLDAAAQ